MKTTALYIFFVVIFTTYSRAQNHKGFYVNGKKKGEVKEYYENGKIKEIANFDTGEITEFFENGNVKQTGYVKYIEYRSGRSGEWKEYYENGKLKNIGIYSSGRRVGKWQQYHNNGQLSGTGLYKEDGVPLPDSWTTYDRSGQKDGLNIPEPQESDFKAICTDIAGRNKAPEAENEFYEYYYQKRLWDLSCAVPGKDSEEIASIKIGKMWNKYKKDFKCDSLSFSLSNGNLLKFGLYQQMPELIETLSYTYGLDINFIDPKDNMNLLDYLDSEIKKVSQQSNNAGILKVYNEYRERIIEAGAKPSK